MYLENGGKTYEEKRLEYAKTLKAFNEKQKLGFFDEYKDKWISFHVEKECPIVKIYVNAHHLLLCSLDTSVRTRIGHKTGRRYYSINYLEAPYDWSQRMYIILVAFEIYIPCTLNGEENVVKFKLNNKKTIFDTGSNINTIDVTHFRNDQRFIALERKNGSYVGKKYREWIFVQNNRRERCRHPIVVQIEDVSRSVGVSPNRILIGTDNPFGNFNFIGDALTRKIIILENDDRMLFVKNRLKLEITNFRD